MLTDIKETYEIQREGNIATAVRAEKSITLPLESSVSMNMWGLPVEFFNVLESGFSKFLNDLKEEEVKKEYLLPLIIGDMLKNGKAQVHVLSSNDRWFGVTYKEDKETVVQAIHELIEQKVYPQVLF